MIVAVCLLWFAPQDVSQLLEEGWGPTEAAGAPPRARPAFKKAAGPKPTLKQTFRARASQKYPSHSQRAARLNFKLGQKGKLGGVFRAHASKIQPSYKQKLPAGLRLRIQSPAKVKSNSVTLGHYPKYVQQSSRNGTRHFNVPTKIWNKMNSVQQWRANKKFLDRAIQRGDKIHLATRMKALSGKFQNSVRPNSAYAREIAYLKSKGYKMSRDGKQMVAPSGRPTGAFKRANNATRLTRLNQAFKKALSAT